ncbi:metallophosphoesterase [Hungatella hathewayi]|uniref:metallophosphoesterase family protein n=1 Tax=Hungatella hathewayi TaxID=154046 RepID=UPI0026E26DC1|nr:metallophosphoesterase [Hungatella hathewayi]
MKQVLDENGADADWTVVTFHHSIYSTASHESDNDIIQRRAELSPVFTELGIDVVLMGHDHVYTRSYMMIYCYRQRLQLFRA